MPSICPPGYPAETFAETGMAYTVVGNPRSNAPVWFNGRNPLPLGTYRIVYITGAYRETVADGWGVGTNWQLCTDDGDGTWTDVVQPPEIANPGPPSVPESAFPGTGYDTPQAAITANYGSSHIDLESTGSTIYGIRNTLADPAGCVTGTPNPTWEFRGIEKCTPLGDPSRAVFEVGKCDIPYIPRIPNEPMIVNCTIPEAPAGIPGPPYVPVPVTPPPPPAPFCPELQIATTQMTWGELPVVEFAVTYAPTHDSCGNLTGCQTQIAPTVVTPHALIPVRVTQSGGTNGGPSTMCSWTYIIYRMDKGGGQGAALDGTTAYPVLSSRQSYGPMHEATHGTIRVWEDGTIELFSVDECEDSTECTEA